jgi:CheY-like chemotaxis protein/HPt (histidine-containing phosphotransfer) domain-containing protein
MASLLQSWGATVHSFSSGPEALRYLYGNSGHSVPTIAFIDESMPEMTGSDLAKTLQSDPSLRNLPRIQLLASHSRLQRMAPGQNDYFNAALVKPVNRSDLAEALNAIISTDNPSPSNPENAPTTGPSTQNSAAVHPVLLVEDNPVNTEVATAWLRQFGLPFDTASNGAEALTALQSKSYSLVFMDIQMPGMNGMETTRRIRRNLRLTSIPIIAMTAHTMAGDRERCLECGMDDFISKPLNRNALQKVLQRWLPAQEAPDRDGSNETESSGSSETFQLQRMLDFIQNENIARGLLRSFLKNLPTELQKLQQALAEDDRPQIQETAHGIKGVAGYFCTDSLRNTAATMEKDALHADPQHLTALFHDLEHQFTVIRKAILEQTPSNWLDDPDS